jgi:hypothetical protein
MARDSQVPPRTYFLNEAHELAPADKRSGGSLPKYVEIDWSQKANRLSGTLRHATSALKRTPDPLAQRRFYLVALPEPTVAKLSEPAKEVPTQYEEKVDYGAVHSKVFGRLGLDLIGVHKSGEATVHATTERFDQLLATALSLAEEGKRERYRWRTIDSFRAIPQSLKVDSSWLATLRANEMVDSVLALHPLVTRVEADTSSGRCRGPWPSSRVAD